jgi:hypothetical protein
VALAPGAPIAISPAPSAVVCPNCRVTATDAASSSICVIVHVSPARRSVTAIPAPGSPLTARPRSDTTATSPSCAALHPNSSPFVRPLTVTCWISGAAAAVPAASHTAAITPDLHGAASGKHTARGASPSTAVAVTSVHT